MAYNRTDGHRPLNFGKGTTEEFLEACRGYMRVRRLSLRTVRSLIFITSEIILLFIINLVIHASKGDKDRHSLFPQNLYQALEEHLEIQKAAWVTAQQVERLPASLPDASERKYPQAPYGWNWQLELAVCFPGIQTFS